MTGRSSSTIRRIVSSDATFASRVDELGPRPAVARRGAGVALTEQRQLALDVVERALRAVEQDEPAPDRGRRPGGRAPTRSSRRRRSRARSRRATRSRRPGSSMTTGSRRSRSSTCDLADRRGAQPTRDELVERRDGPRLEPERVASSTARRTTSPDADGIAISSRRAPVTRAIVRELVERAEDLLAAQDLVPLARGRRRAGRRRACRGRRARRRSSAGRSRRRRPRRRRASGHGPDRRRRRPRPRRSGIARPPALPLGRGADQEPDAAHPGQRQQALEDEERAREVPDRRRRARDAERHEDAVEDERSRRSSPTTTTTTIRASSPTLAYAHARE